MNDLKEKIITNLEELTKRISYVMNQIFDSCRFPGGTAPSGASSSIIVCTIYVEKMKEFFFLVLPYNSKCKINKDKGCEKETPQETARREFYEETRLEINLNDLHLLYSVDVPDTIHKGMVHTKNVYHIDGSKVAGHLAEFVFSKANPMNNDNNPETGTPILIPTSYLFKILFKKHHEMAKKAILYLIEDEEGKAMEDRDYAHTLISLSRLVSVEVNF